MVSAVTLPSVRALPARLSAAPPAAAAPVTEGYAGAPRCDGPTGTPMVPGKKLLFQLQGNSIAVELRELPEGDLRVARCDLRVHRPVELPHLQRGPGHRGAGARHPSRRGDPVPVRRVRLPVWRALARVGRQARRVLEGDGDARLPRALGALRAGEPREDDLGPGPLLEAEYYRALAEADPEHITLLDAGAFLRDANGHLPVAHALPRGRRGGLRRAERRRRPVHGRLPLLHRPRLRRARLRRRAVPGRRTPRLRRGGRPASTCKILRANPAFNPRSDAPLLRFAAQSVQPPW